MTHNQALHRPHNQGLHRPHSQDLHRPHNQAHRNPPKQMRLVLQLAAVAQLLQRVPKLLVGNDPFVHHKMSMALT